jgi:hypothetical protein
MKQDLSLNKPQPMQESMTTGEMNRYTLDQEPQYMSHDKEAGFGDNKLLASTQIRGMRWRWIHTDKNIWDSKLWTIFADSLKDGDTRYDNVDRKLKAYATWYTDLWRVQQFDTRAFHKKGEYVMYNGIMYLALQDSNITQVPWTIDWEWIWKAVIQYQSQLPYDNSAVSYYQWFTALWCNPWNNTMSWSQYQGISYITDEFGYGEDGVIVIPVDGFYITIEKTHRLERPWNVNISSSIKRQRWIGGWETVSASYRYVPTITCDTWIITHWPIYQDSTSNIFMDYMEKGDRLRVELNQDGASPIEINADKIQCVRIF